MPNLSETLNTPILDAGDVCIIGAGSAGIAAAIGAARLGVKVSLIDPAGFPGGTLVSGLPILGGWDGEKQVVRGLYAELVARLREIGGTEDDPALTTAINVDLERLKIVVLQMLAEAGVQLRLHTMLSRAVVEERHITHAVVEGKGGRVALAAHQFIDATGDADLAYSAGVPCEKGRMADGKMQPMTLMFGIGNIHKERFSQWGSGSTNAAYQKMTALWADLRTRESFSNPRTDFAHFWGAPSRCGEWAFNATRVINADGTDAASLTQAEVEGRLQAYEMMERFLRPHVPGFEKAYIVWTAAKIGVREGRRIVGDYVLNRDDIWNFVKFPDTINCGSYPIDIHNPDGASTEFPKEHFYGGKYWTIPYRSLLPHGVDNLLVAGRCLSATHEAMSAVRCMANTIGMGEAAGYAAALAVHQSTLPRCIEARAVQNELLLRGGWLGE